VDYAQLLTAWWLPVLVAPFIGSFLGVLILRLPECEPVVFARSRCPSCGHTLGVWDLLPLMSWFALHRRCRYCGSALGWFYPNIELAALGVAVWGATAVSGWLLWATCALGWALLALAVTDVRRMILPDALTIPLLGAGLGLGLFLPDPQPLQHVIGAAVGFGAFFLIGHIYRVLRHRDGLGLGDAKLLAAGGAWVSWVGLPSVVLLAAATGLLMALTLMALGNRAVAVQRLPFGPELCLGIWLVWLYGPLTVG
jgi:leader peptidase (prepilin peptidase) / N-methyltransferase